MFELDLDDQDTDELSAALTAPPQRHSFGDLFTAAPVYTETISGLALTVVHVLLPRQGYQLYAEDGERRVLVGLFSVYPNALHEIAAWRAYLAGGGTLCAWVAEHPDGVQPR